jgi:hypothetical protein
MLKYDKLINLYYLFDCKDSQKYIPMNFIFIISFFSNINIIISIYSQILNLIVFIFSFSFIINNLINNLIYLYIFDIYYYTNFIKNL